MCGIAGIFKAEGKFVSSEETSILISLLSHRGPDGNEIWRSNHGEAALVHTRLSILDPGPAAAQPMSSFDGRYVISYNGEVFNFLELREELLSKGRHFHSDSDTEVVLAAWQEWGEAMLSRFNGMWAFAIYDVQTRELVLARDRFGIKPLYYYSNSQEFVFASEIRAIACLRKGQFSPNTSFVGSLLRYDRSCFGGFETWLGGILSVSPGTLLRYRAGQIEASRWYQLGPVDVPQRLSDQAERFRELLQDACRVRLRSDVPVATCLSGGVDSGSIVSILGMGLSSDERSLNFKHTNYNAAFPGTALDEREAATAIALRAGMDLESLVIDCPSPSELELAMRFCDGPMPALAFYPIWRLYRHIKSCGVSVTLDGQGADEMMGGYLMGYPAVRGGWQSRNPIWLLDLTLTYSRLSPGAWLTVKEGWRHLLRVICSDAEKSVKDPLKRALAKRGLYDLSRTKGRLDSVLPSGIGTGVEGTKNELAIELFRQFFVSPLPFLLHQYDRCSMASGVECRMPFLDHRLVEYVFSLPLSSRIGGGYSKRVLRESMKGILPDPVRTNRTKIGFNAPYARWCSGALREWIEDMKRTPEFAVAEEIRRESAPETGFDVEKETVAWPVLHLAWALRDLRKSDLPLPHS